jgi:serine/threonine-protein kinase
MGSRAKYIWLVVKMVAAAAVTLTVTVVLFFLLAGRIVSGGQPVQVPNLINMTIVDALAELEDTGLKLDPAISHRFSSIVDQNCIISQDPAPGKMVKSSRTLRVVLSRGTELIRVPDITGGDIRQAAVTLADAGLRPASEIRIQFPARRDIVVGQDPPEGELLPRDGGVNLLVSHGPQRVSYAMPNLVGRSLDEVAETLNALNLRISNKREVHRETAEDVVFYQNPLPGMAVVEGDTVQTKVSVSGDLPQWQSLEGAILRYVVPQGFPRRHIRIEVQDAEERWTEFNGMVDPGTIMRVPVVYKKWLDVEIRLDGTAVERRTIRETGDTTIPLEFFERVYPARPFRVQWRP